MAPSARKTIAAAEAMVYLMRIPDQLSPDVAAFEPKKRVRIVAHPPAVASLTFLRLAASG